MLLLDMHYPSAYVGRQYAWLFVVLRITIGSINEYNLFKSIACTDDGMRVSECMEYLNQRYNNMAI